MMLEKIISSDEWINTYQHPNTRRQAGIALKAWKRFSPDNQTMELMKADTSSNMKYITLQRMIKYFTEEGISGKSIRNYWNFIRNWWWYNGIKTDPLEIKSFVKFPKILKEIREPMTREIIKQICDASIPYYKAFWLVLASSGMRPEELIKTEKANLHLDEMPARIYLTPTITKSAQGRNVFISKQAANELTNNLEEVMGIKAVAYRLYFSKLRRKLGFKEKYSNGKNFLVQVYALRSFFFTQATMKHGSDYAHAMTGHGQYLDQYLRIPNEKRIQMYFEIEPSLTI